MLFLNPLALLLLVLLVPFALFLFQRERRRDAARARLGEAALVNLLSVNPIPGRRRLKMTLWLAAMAALIIALARPAWGMSLETVEAQGVSVMLVLDVSSSMLARDVLPNRLERAKLVIRDLLEALKGDEIGLIVFAGTAYLQFPLTTDSSSAVTFLNAVSERSVARQGTAITAALELALESFDQKSLAARVIILVSDGENHGSDPLRAAAAGADDGIIIHSIGFGSPEGALIPVADEAGRDVGYKTDRGGQLVETRLNESLLRSVSERTGGLYQRASATGIEVQTLVQQIRALEAGVLESQVNRRIVERFGIFVLLGLLALSFEILIPESVQGTR